MIEAVTYKFRRSQSNRQYTLDEKFFENIDTEQKAYWLGFILADGCISQDSLVIALASRDKRHLKKFLKDIESNYKIHDRTCVRTFNGKTKEYRESRIQIGSKKLVQGLLKQGVTPNKSLTAEPIKVKKDLQRHFWRGVFDGDGSIAKKYFRINLGGTPTICRGFLNVINHLSFESNPVIFLDKELKNFARFRLNKQRDVLKVLDYLYKDAKVYLDRKYDLYQKLKNKKIREYSNEFKEYAIELYNGGLNAGEVSKVIGLDFKDSVIRWVRDAGYPVRNNSFTRWLLHHTMNSNYNWK